jgi:hypothetical protein
LIYTGAPRSLWSRQSYSSSRNKGEGGGTIGPGLNGFFFILYWISQYPNFLYVFFGVVLAGLILFLAVKCNPFFRTYKVLMRLALPALLFGQMHVVDAAQREESLIAQHPFAFFFIVLALFLFVSAALIGCTSLFDHYLTYLRGRASVHPIEPNAPPLVGYEPRNGRLRGA